MVALVVVFGADERAWMSWRMRGRCWPATSMQGVRAKWVGGQGRGMLQLDVHEQRLCLEPLSSGGERAARASKGIKHKVLLTIQVKDERRALRIGWGRQKRASNGGDRCCWISTVQGRRTGAFCSTQLG